MSNYLPRKTTIRLKFDMSPGQFFFTVLMAFLMIGLPIGLYESFSPKNTSEVTQSQGRVAGTYTRSFNQSQRSSSNSDSNFNPNFTFSTPKLTEVNWILFGGLVVVFASSCALLVFLNKPKIDKAKLAEL